jgi:hypothetical protein
VTSTKDVLDGLCETRLKSTLEIERGLFKKQSSRSTPIWSERTLFQAGLLALQSMPKMTCFFTHRGIDSKIDSKRDGIDTRDGMQ